MLFQFVGCCSWLVSSLVEADMLHEQRQCDTETWFNEPLCCFILPLVEKRRNAMFRMGIYEMDESMREVRNTTEIIDVYTQSLYGCFITRSLLWIAIHHLFVIVKENEKNNCFRAMMRSCCEGFGVDILT